MSALDQYLSIADPSSLEEVRQILIDYNLQIEKEIQNDTKIDSTERTAISKARRGQGRFRANAMSIEPKCRLTGVTDPRLLRAGHIKPWWCCANNHERLDG